MAEAGSAFSMCGLHGGSVLASGLPLVREQFGQPALGVSADALKQIAQIGKWGGWRIYNVVGFVKGHDDLRVLGAGSRAPQAFIADP